MRSTFVSTSIALKPTLVSLAFLGFCVFALPARAVTVFDFSGPSDGPVGSASYAVTEGSVTITAHGYDANNADHDLYWKHAGADETGLGLVGTLDHELTLTDDGSAIANYIQFDVTQAVSATTSQAFLQSVTNGEAFDLYASNVAGQIGTPILTDSTADETLVDIPDWGTFDFLSVSVAPLGDAHANDNVLPQILEFNFPPAAGPSVPLPPAAWGGLVILSIIIAGRALKGIYRTGSRPIAF